MACGSEGIGVLRATHRIDVTFRPQSSMTMEEKRILLIEFGIIRDSESDPREHMYTPIMGDEEEEEGSAEPVAPPMFANTVDDVRQEDMECKQRIKSSFKVFEDACTVEFSDEISDYVGVLIVCCSLVKSSTVGSSWSRASAARASRASCSTPPQAHRLPPEN